MNVDDLKQSLDTLAAEVDNATVVAHERLSGVDRKVVRAKRTRLAALAGSVAAVVGAAALVAPTIPGDSATPPTSDVPTVSDNGVSLYTTPAGGKLVAHMVTVPGSRSATVTVAPPSLDLAWSVQCWDAAATGREPARGQTNDFRLIVNGKFLSAGNCEGPYDGTPMLPDSYMGYGAPQGNESGWRDLGLAAGESATLTIRLTNPVADGRLPQLALGLWQRGPQNHDSGVWYPRELVIDGKTYVAEVLTTNPFEARRADIPVRLGTSYDDYWITGGIQQLDGRGILRVGNGAIAAADRTGGAELGGGYRSPQDPVQVTFKSNKRQVVSGVLYAIVYHPLNAP